MTEEKTLAELQTLPIDEYFEHEEYDFTRWLANNIDRLEAENLLNLPLNVREREAPIGRYKADILAHDPEGDRTVVIENQYGQTDHTHLGQALVYTAGTEADVVVWIAESFTDEHISVFRWLNERTDGKASFFAIEVNLRRIDDSPYAVEFTAVERPDEWSKQISDTNLTETERAQLRFWHEYVERTHDRGLSHLSGNTPTKGASHAVHIGHGGIYIRPTARFGSNELIAMIRFTDGETTFGGIDRDAFEDTLARAAEELDSEYFDRDISGALQWEEAEEGETYDHIKLARNDVDFNQRDKWDEYHDWLIDAAELFKKTLEQTTR